MKEAVVVLLVDEETVLMQHRDDIPTIYMPGRWSIPGGQFESNEVEAVMAALREFKEETGYELLEPSYFKFIFIEFEDEKVKLYCFWETYDKIQEIHCFEGQEMAFKSLEELADLPVIPGQLSLVKEAISLANKG